MFVEHKEAVEITEAPAKLDEASRLLLKAAALLEDKGWCQGDYTIDGRYCLMGALTMADTGNIGVRSNTGSIAVNRLMASIDVGWLRWNDSAERTKEQVVAKLRAVALGL